MPSFQCSYGTTITIGANVAVNHESLFMDDARITIGDDALIGPRSQLITAWHPVDDHEHRRSRWLWERCEPISIGANSWLATSVIVCPGVSIGRETVVGSGSVVTRDLPDRVFAAGNPARVIRPL